MTNNLLQSDGVFNVITTVASLHIKAELIPTVVGVILGVMGVSLNGIAAITSNHRDVVTFSEECVVAITGFDDDQIVQCCCRTFVVIERNLDGHKVVVVTNLNQLGGSADLTKLANITSDENNVVTFTGVHIVDTELTVGGVVTEALGIESTIEFTGQNDVVAVFGVGLEIPERFIRIATCRRDAVIPVGDKLQRLLSRTQQPFRFRERTNMGRNSVNRDIEDVVDVQRVVAGIGVDIGLEVRAVRWCGAQDVERAEIQLTQHGIFANKLIQTEADEVDTVLVEGIEDILFNVLD